MFLKGVITVKMNSECVLSNVTKEYLDRFYCILDEMIKGMSCAELIDSISHNFIVQMIPHHKAAIDMSLSILKYTTCIPLQNIALGIVSSQTESIENMREIQCSCSELQNSECDVKLYQRKVEQIMNTMFSQMSEACSDNNINANFMREMIPHHEGAIKMSKNALQYDICPGLKPILCAIINSQERGVAEMKRLLKSGRCC